MGLAATITIIFSIIMLGYIFARLKILSDTTGDGLADFVFVVSTPLLLFRTMITADFQSSNPWELWLVYFTGVVVAWGDFSWQSTIIDGVSPPACWPAPYGDWCSWRPS